MAKAAKATKGRGKATAKFTKGGTSKADVRASLKASNTKAATFRGAAATAGASTD